MATAEEKRTITKKRLQELRNMCREHYNVLIEEGTMPDAADVRVTNQKLEELMELLDGKIKWDNAWFDCLARQGLASSTFLVVTKHQTFKCLTWFVWWVSIRCGFWLFGYFSKPLLNFSILFQ